jgi:WD40 repeat protein
MFLTLETFLTLIHSNLNSSSKTKKRLNHIKIYQYREVSQSQQQHSQQVVSKTVLNQQLASLTSSLSHSLAQHSQSAKSALLSSKTRINNLSFPKFKKPNANGAREFIMQSINSSKSKNGGGGGGGSSAGGGDSSESSSDRHMNSKMQCTLFGHKDGIWDINCVPIPNHLIANSTSSSTNLLIGTASADNSARLWYFNATKSSYQQQQHQQFMSPATNSQTASQVQTAGFCIQEYSGHTGSVNSLRFHPKFFTEATNLILTGAGDCQAHIWQCVISPTVDSFESFSDILLNYSNCHSIAMNSYFAAAAASSSSSNFGNSLVSPQQQQHLPSSMSCPSANSFTNFGSLSPNQPGTTNSSNNNQMQSSSLYQDLLANTAIIRSPIRRYEGHSDACIAAEWFPDGELLATASWDRTANVYNVETGKVLCQLQHDDYLTNVSIHRSHKIILTSSKDTTFKVWDFRDPICSVQIYQGHNRSVNSAIFVGDAQIATASDDQTVKVSKNRCCFILIVSKVL